jgi:oxalate---CoA ligase
MSHVCPVAALPPSDTDHTIWDLLRRQAERVPDSPALMAPDGLPLTFGELLYQTEKIASHLSSRGVGRGDRVAIVLPNGLEMAVAFLAVTAVATAVPLNPESQVAEFGSAMADLRVRALLTQAGSSSPAIVVARERGLPIFSLTSPSEARLGVTQADGEVLETGAQRRLGRLVEGPTEADVALVLQTSGTTARPKIVPLTHRNLCASARDISNSRLLGAADCCLNLVPLFHVYGLISMLSALTAGASFVCAPGCDPRRFFEWLDHYRPTYYTAVPTMHQAILAEAPSHLEILERSTLRFVPSSGAPLPPPVLTELESTFSAPVLESYGMSETCLLTTNRMPPYPRKPGSVGPSAGPEVAVADELGRLLPPGATGEVVVRGPNVMGCYEENPAANQAAFVDGWFRTGDQGYLDEDGYLFLTGRLKEMINRGGENVAPREVDEALLSHPAVSQAVTFALPHVRLGEEVAAAVVLRADAAATESELRVHVAARLSMHKVPRRILFLEELPRGPSGKLVRIGLADRLGLNGAETAAGTRREEFAAPRTPVETTLAEIWTSVLDVEQIGVRDNFFDVGGDSMRAVQLFERIEKAFGRRLPLSSLFEAGTIEELAARLAEESPDRGWSSLVAIQPAGSRPPFFCLHALGGTVLFYQRLAQHLGEDQPFYALQSLALHRESPTSLKLEELAACYIQEVAAVQPTGPYLLGGYSFGGVVAYEMARQLDARGEKIALLALVDTWGPACVDQFAVSNRIGLHLRAMARMAPAELARYSLQRVAGVGKKALKLPRQVKHRWQHATRAPLPRSADSVLMIHRGALKQYRPAPYPGRIILFRASERGIFEQSDPQMGWGQLANGGLEIQEIPGNHVTIFHKENTRVLAQKLRSCIDGVLRTGS